MGQFWLPGRLGGLPLARAERMDGWVDVLAPGHHTKPSLLQQYSHFSPSCKALISKENKYFLRSLIRHQD